MTRREKLIPTRYCVECGRQYAGSEMLLRPLTKVELKTRNLKLEGTYDGCLWP